jgi:signal transduction histidine kinase
MERGRKNLWSFNSALAAVGGVFLVAIVYSGHLFSEKTEQLAKAVANLALAELQIDSVYTLVLEAESSQRGYLVTHDAAYLEPYRTARELTQKSIAEAEQQIVSVDVNSNAGRLADLRATVLQKFDELAETIALVERSQANDALSVVRSNRGRDLMSRISLLAAREQEKLASLRERRIAEMQDSASKLTFLSLIGVIAICLFAVLAVMQLATHSRALGLAQAKLAAVNEKLAAANDALEQRVGERTLDLQRANEEIQRYAYIVSHDLRAPLVNIIGFAKELEAAASSLKPLLDAPGLDRDDPTLTQAAAALNEDIPEALKFIRSSTSRMDNLIAGILQLSRLGGMALQPQLIDLEQLAGECVASVQHRLNDAGATVEIESPLPKVVGDRAAISQVLGNLLDNAAKYLSSERAGRIVLRGRAAGPRVIVEVEDNGRGIAPKDHRRIFELFRRAGAQDRPGDGIGLAHVRTLARRMGGEIKVRSDGQSGSVFTVTLPSDLRAIISREPKDA